MRPRKQEQITVTAAQLAAWNAFVPAWLAELRDEDARPAAAEDSAFQSFMAKVLHG